MANIVSHGKTHLHALL